MRGWTAVAGTVLVAVLIIFALARLPHPAQILPWVRAHWLNAVAITAAATIVAASMPLLITLLGRAQSGLSPRDREAALRRVRNKWITEFLEPSLTGMPHLSITLQRRGDLLDPGKRIFPSPGPRRQPTPLERTIAEEFDHVGGALLILGDPGMGKTTLLLQLARQLLDRAEKDKDQPIPVVANLGPWATRGQPLATWLPDELFFLYSIPHKASEAWLRQDKLILLLDGFDEVADPSRAGCAAEINAYRHDHGSAGIVVCSRTRELQDLTIKLKLDEAIELQPQDDATIDDYLRQMEAANANQTGLRADVSADGTLRDLLRSPLMLHTITLACQDRTALPAHSADSSTQLHESIWRTYVTRMFQLHPLDPASGYSVDQALTWLTWLAQATRALGQAEFRLDQLDFTWAPAGVGGGFLHEILDMLREKLREFPPFGRIFRPVHSLTLSWKRTSWGLLRGVSLGVLTAAILGSVFYGFILAISPTFRKAFFHLTHVYNAHLVAPEIALALLLSFYFGLAGALHAGLTVSEQQERRAPNEGIRQAAKCGLFVAIPCGVITALFMFQADSITRQPSTPVGPEDIMVMVMGRMTAVIGVALITGSMYGWGACLQHYLVRAVLARTGAAPWHYQAFLDAMSERALLRRAGGSYLFLHPLLRDYLAQPDVGESLEPERHRSSSAAGEGPTERSGR